MLSQLVKGLQFPEWERTKAGYAALHTHRIITLETINSAHLAEAYKKELASLFSAEFQAVDFAAADAAELINGWVEQKTKEKIKDLIKADQLSNNTKMVLVNAIYFKGS